MQNRYLIRIARIALIIPCLMLFFNSAQARVSVVLSVAPAPQVYVAPPGGYANCYTVSSGMYNGVWVNAHQICNYGDTPDAGIWIGGYWGCANYSPVGVCMGWNWWPAHWVRPGFWEYGVRWPHGHPYFNPHYHHNYPYPPHPVVYHGGEVYRHGGEGYRHGGEDYRHDGHHR